MTIQELQQEILRLKKEKEICILAHSYQAREITEIADCTGDSYQLSVQANRSAKHCYPMRRSLYGGNGQASVPAEKGAAGESDCRMSYGGANG